MPMCPTCQGPASSAELKPAGPDKELACGTCRKPKSMEGQKMGEKLVSKSVFSLNISEVQTGDGGKDYLINASVRSGAVNFQFEATIDQVRTFFTERREKAQQQIAAD